MRQSASPLSGVLAASIAAGPLFMLTTTLAELYTQIPGAIPIDPGDALLMILFAAATVPVGFLLSFLPNLLGSSVMARAGAASVTARTPLVWAGAGALLAGAPAIHWLGDEPFGQSAVFGLIATGAGCASICRRFSAWR